VLFHAGVVQKREELQLLSRARSASRPWTAGEDFKGQHEVPPHDIVRSGPLLRLTSWGKWKERYFVMDRVGIYWYHNDNTMRLAREDLARAPTTSLKHLVQHGLKIPWGLTLRLTADFRVINQMTLSSTNKVMKLRATSEEEMNGWIIAVDTLRLAKDSDLKQKRPVELRETRDALMPPSNQLPRRLSDLPLGRAMLVAGNTAIVRTRSASEQIRPFSPKSDPVNSTKAVLAVPEVIVVERVSASGAPRDSGLGERIRDNSDTPNPDASVAEARVSATLVADRLTSSTCVQGSDC